MPLRLAVAVEFDLTIACKFGPFFFLFGCVFQVIVGGGGVILWVVVDFFFLLVVVFIFFI